MSELKVTTPGKKTAAAARPTVRGRPSQAQSQAITDEILARAAGIFLHEGFDGTTMEMVASAVGVPKTTLYKRFPDKLALLNGVLRDRVASWSKVTSKQDQFLSDDLRERLIQFNTTILIWSGKSEVMAFTRLALSASGRGADAQGPDFFAYNDMVDYLRDEIQTYGPQSGIRAKAPRPIAQMIMAMNSGWLQRRGLDQTVSEAEAREQATFTVDLLMKGAAAW